ncbi:MAG: hypothetical protein ACOYMQ_18575, partial [Pseudanabaena sp.]
MSFIQRELSRRVPNRAKLPESKTSAEVAIENNVIQGNNNTVTIINHSGGSAIAQVNEAEVFPYSKVYITEKPPKEVAILYIQAEGDSCYRLIGGNAEIAPLLTDPEKRPELSLGESVQEKLSPEDIRDDMNHFSRVNIKIRKWLKQLRK